MSASCHKCVKVLRDLISGLQQDNRDGRTSIQKNNSTQSPPLTLLKAIAEGAMNAPAGRQDSQPRQLRVEQVEDGVRLTIPVETTMPHVLRRWTKLLPPAGEPLREQDDDDDELLQPLYHAMATSANDHRSDSKQSDQLADPLTIELKCRKCASSGPEGGARAFLMGPQPLSVVLCHNRIASSKEEVEEILTHELVHLFDVQTLQLDLQDCENLAYSEVRAAKAAECRDSWKQLQPYCVKQKAISATNNLYPSEGRSCIQRVFRTAFHDNRPFDDPESRRVPPTSRQSKQREGNANAASSGTTK
jgi:hypothetical protein